ncbi:MAG: nucleotidyltransferase domain-containing protein [Ruminococcus sp.]|nr:nucleotidyltransferase domain-containing protein [Ruminococcus sp.]
MYTIEEIKQTLTPIFSEYNVKKAVLFGSYAKNCADEKSDIDICVDSGLRGLDFFGLLEDVCTSVTCPVDMFDVIEINTGSKMEQEIQKTGVVIFERA